jgi:hypothetical protein
MKIGLKLKLGIGIVVVFGLLLLGHALWTPLKIKYYIGQLHSNDDKARISAIDAFVNMEKEGIAVLEKEFGSWEEADFLVKHWRNVNELIRDRQKVPPLPRLTWECKKNKNKYVDGIVNEYTPLHLAVEKNYIIAADLIIAKGADLNSNMAWYRIPPIDEEPDSDGIRSIGLVERVGTPLHIASREDNIAMINLLISHGADVNRQSAITSTSIPSSPSPLDYASDEKTRQILRKYGAKTGEEIESSEVNK